MRQHGLSACRAARIAALALALATLLREDVAEAVGATGWVTGTGLQRRLSRPVNVVWSGNPLRKALHNLSRAQQVAMLIDRRVDPGRKLQLQLEGVPLETALKEIARSQGLGVSWLGPVAYFGPPAASTRLRTIAALRTEEIRRLPPATGRKFLQPKRIAWNDFATPGELLTDLAEQNGLELAGLDRVPHDLWAGADLPPLSLVDRLTLIAVQFDLTFQISPDARTLTLAPVPADVALVRSYPGGKQPKATAETYASILPEAQIKVVGNEVYVKGLLEEHERLTSPRRPPQQPDRQPTRDAERTRIDRISFQNLPVGLVLETLATRLKLDLKIDRKALARAGISLKQHVSLSAENVTVDELFRKVTQPVGLRFRRRGNVIEIGPAEPSNSS